MYLMGTRTKGKPVFVRLCSTLLKPGFPCSQFVEIVGAVNDDCSIQQYKFANFGDNYGKIALAQASAAASLTSLL